jgi:hypothetical protein
VRADHEIGKDAWAEPLIVAATQCITFKSTARGAPYLLVDIPIDGDADIFEKRVEKSIGARGERQKFCVDGRSHDRSVSEGRVKPGAGGGVQGIVLPGRFKSAREDGNRKESSCLLRKSEHL